MDFFDFAFGDDCEDFEGYWTSGFSSCYGRGYAGFGEGGVFTFFFFFFLHRGRSDECYDDNSDDDDDEYGGKLVLYYFYLVS